MKKHKFDFIVIIALVLVAGISWFIIENIYKSEGNFVQVLVDGNIKYEYSLNKDGEYEIKTGDFVNVIQVKAGQVSMKEADCPDKLCVKQGKISKDGQSIICLPHKIVVRVTSEQGDAVDAHTK